MKVAILDYGMGNVDSVARAVAVCGGTPMLTSSASELEHARAVILPGVGAFAEGMRSIRERDLAGGIVEVAERGVPLLGLCLGMQLLATHGTEGEEVGGLALIPAKVCRLEPGEGLRVPHVGWNEVVVARQAEIFAGIPSGRDFYFAHSFEFRPDDERDVLARTTYGQTFVSAVGRGSVLGVQFHPEKSQRAGLQLLRNFLALARGAAADPPRAVAAPGL